MPFPRIPAARVPNRLTQAMRRVGRVPYDLTLSNPTLAGFDYPRDLLAPLAVAEALRYKPEPLGLPEARAAVAADYARRGISIDPAQIVLTASTSDAYSLVFRLLCRPEGDRALAPAPSYPLFDHLARLDGVALDPYALEYHGRWCLALDSLDRAWRETSRVVLAVTPNNPTGSVLTASELGALDEACARRGACLVLDEVFADYPLDDAEAASVASAPPAAALTFRFGGLSKSAGLPQVKLGWMAVDGPPELVTDALDALEMICDTYLAVSTPVQVAAGPLIEAGAHIRQQIAGRVRRNFEWLRQAVSRHPAVDLLPVEAGWSAVLRVPAVRPEEELVIDLLEKHGVLVHPGFFFDFPHEAFLVVSLLPPPETFEAGATRLLELADG